MACRKASGHVGTHHSTIIRQPSVERVLGASENPPAYLSPVLSRTRAAVAHAATLCLACASTFSRFAAESRTSPQSSRRAALCVAATMSITSLSTVASSCEPPSASSMPSSKSASLSSAESSSSPWPSSVAASRSCLRAGVGASPVALPSDSSALRRAMRSRNMSRFFESTSPRSGSMW